MFKKSRIQSQPYASKHHPTQQAPNQYHDQAKYASIEVLCTHQANLKAPIRVKKRTIRIIKRAVIALFCFLPGFPSPISVKRRDWREGLQDKSLLPD